MKPRIELLEDRVVPTVELEPNSSLLTATGMPRQYDAMVGSLADASDVDFFSVGMAPGAMMRVVPASTNPINGDEQPWFTPSIDVFDEAGVLRAESHDGTWLYLTAPVGGTFYIRVTSQGDFGDYTGAYSIPVSVDPFAGLTEVESNDTFATANSLGSDTTFRGFLPTAADRDYFAFAGSSGQVVSFKFANGLSLNPSVRLYDPTGTLVATDLTGAGLVEKLADTGDYRFEIRGDNAAGQVTTFYVGQILLENSGDAETTPNDSFANAAILDLSSGAAIASGTLSSMSDLAVYAVDFTAMNFYDFTLDAPAGPMLLQSRIMSLYDENGQLLQSTKAGYISSFDWLDARIEKAGVHYLVVQATNETGLGGYAVSARNIGSFPTQRDIPVFYHDYSAYTEASHIPFLVGMFEARFSPYFVDVTTTAPSSGESVTWTFASSGGGGVGGGYYGVRRPQGGASGGQPLYTGLADYYLAIHENGHAVGMNHTRHPEAAMHYFAQSDIFPIGQTYRQAGQPAGDSYIPTRYVENERNYLDWATQAGEYLLEAEPNDSQGAAQDMDPSFANMSSDADPRNDQVIMVGTIDSLNDRDFFSFTATAGQIVRFDVDSAEFQEPLDSTLLLYDAAGMLLAANTGGLDRNSGLTSVDPNLTYQFSADGTYYIQINGVNSTVGNYRLKVTPDRAFDISPPRVVATGPDGDTTIDSTRQLLFFFNKELDPATLTAGNVIIAGANVGTQSGTSFFDPLDNVLVWTADAPLPIDTYNVILLSGITDLWGNALDGETTGATLAWPDVSGNGVAGGDFLSKFVVNADDTSAAGASVSYQRHPSDRGMFTLVFDDQMSIVDLYTKGITVRGDGADNTFDTSDDTFVPADVLYNKIEATRKPSVVYVYTRGIPDADDYRLEGTYLDAAGNTVNLAATITLTNPQDSRGGGGVKPPVPETALASDAAFTVPGLTGSYVDSSLRTYSPKTDWRSTQTVVGTRVDPQIWFPTPGWGVRSTVGITGGSSDADWDNFSVQWDGFIRTTEANTEVYLSSDDGSQLWIDLNSNGTFANSAPEYLDNNWGATQGTTLKGSIVIATPGTYAIRIQYYEGAGGNEAYLLWREPGKDGYGQQFRHGPTVSFVTPSANSATTTAPSSIQVTFNGDMDVSTLTTATFKVRYSTDATFYNGDDAYVSEANDAIAWDPYGHVATFSPASPLANGYYMVELDGSAAGIRDLAGTLLDGELMNSEIAGSNLITQWHTQVSGDGIAGGSYQAYFVVTAPPGVVITQSAGSTDITEGGATDTYTVALATQPLADVTITLSADSQATVNPTTLTFTPLNWDTPQIITVQAVNDVVIEGAHSSTITHSASSSDLIYDGIAIADVVANITDNDFLNQAPVNSVPGAQTTNEDVAKVFNAAGSNLISISDPDAGGSSVQVTLAVTNGVLTLSGVTGLSFSFSDANGAGAGDGTADATMRFRGTIANINAALNGLSFIPTLHFFGSATLTITTNDLGNSGIGGPLTDSDPVDITVSSLNDPPANIVPAAAQSTPEETAKIFSAATSNRIAVGDPDDADNGAVGDEVVQVTLTAANGLLSLNSTTNLSFSFSDANGSSAGDGTDDATMTFRGSITDVNNALDGLRFTPPLNFVGATASVTIVSNDLGNFGAGSVGTDSDTVAITVTAVNDPPVNTVPGPQSTVEETAKVFSSAAGNLISIDDVDDADDGAAGNEPMQVTLTATSGVITLPATTGLSFSFSDANGTGAGDGTNDATMTFRGTRANINNALNGLSFTPALDFVGAASLAVITKDRGNFGTGGNLTASDSVTINVTPVNDAPVNTVPAAQSTPEDIARVFSSANGNLIAIADPDDADDGVPANEPIQVTLSATTGTLTLSGVNGLDFGFSDGNGAGAGDGTADANMTFRGTRADVNAALAGMSFLSPLHYNGAGSASLTITSNDLGNFGTGTLMTDTDSVAITVTAVNDAPVNSVPGAQSTTEETVLVFNAANTNLISVGDVDDADDGTAGNEMVQVTLTATNGTLSLSGTSGLSFSFFDANGASAGDGTDDATMTFRGALGNVNAALNGLSYRPNLDFAAAAGLTITTKDLGNFGSGGNQTDLDTVVINVTQVNDAPRNIVPGNQTVAEDALLVFSNANSNRIAVGDADDADDGATGNEMVQVALAAVNGTLTLNGTGGLSFSFSDGNGASAGDGTDDATMTFRGTLVNVNAALNGMSYRSLLHFSGAGSLSITTNDLGNFGTGTALTDSDAFDIAVTAVNDAPVNSIPGAQTTAEQAPLVFATANANAISVTDPDDADDGVPGNEMMQVALAASNGTLSLNGAAGLSFSFSDINGFGAGDGTDDSAMTFRGMRADINAALEGLSFNPNVDFTGAATVTVTTKDLGNFGAGGNLTDADTVNVTVTPVNDAPVNTVPGAQTVAEEAVLNFSAGNGNRISVDDVDDADDGSIGNETVQVTLTAAGGALSLSTNAGLNFSFTDANGVGAGDGTADTTMTFRGTLSNVNTALNGMNFVSLLDFNGAASVTITTKDLGNFGAGGVLTDSDTVNITVTPVNDAPSNTVPSARSLVEDNALIFSVANSNAISVDDPDDGDDGSLGNQTVQVTLAAVKGTLTLDGVAGLSFSFADANGASAGDGTDDASMTFRGMLADVNAALNGMIFNPTAHAVGVASVTITTKDLGNFGSGGNLTDTDTVNISVSQVNDAPSNNVPGNQSIVEETPLVFSAAAGNRISVSDVDDADNTIPGDETMQVRLVMSGGVLTLGITTGLSFSFSDANGTGTGDGIADAAMTFRGSLNNVNNALGGLRFNPAPNFAGNANLTITTKDLGNFGVGGNLTDSDTVLITVSSVNDAPVNTAPASQTTFEDVPLVFALGNGNAIRVADFDDADDGVAGDEIVQVTLSATNGTVTLSTVAGLSFNFSDANGEGVGDGAADAAMTFRAALADINAALEGSMFTPATHFNGPAALSILADDMGNFGTGGPLTDSEALAITVTSVNDAPTFNLLGNQAVVIGSGAQTVPNFATGMSVGPINENTQTLLGFTLTQIGSSGALTFTAAPLINLTTGTLTYQPTAAAFGTVTYAVTLRDSGPSAPPPNENTSLPRIFTISVLRSSSLAVTPAPTSAVYGQATTLTVGVTGGPAGVAGPPTGAITVTDTFNGSTTTLASNVSLAGGVVTGNTVTIDIPIGVLDKGTHTLTTFYSGDANILASSKTISRVIAAAGTTTSFTATTPAAVYGTAVSYAGKVTSAGGLDPVAGTVTLKNGTTILAAVALSGSNLFDFTNVPLPLTLGVGTRSITAVFTPANGNYLGSTSAASALAITQALTVVSTPTSSVTDSPLGGSYRGQTVKFTVNVTATNSAATPMGGTVTFKRGGTILGTVNLLAGGTASYTASVAQLPVNDSPGHAITAIYNSSNPSSPATANFKASAASTAFVQAVSPATTDTLLTSSMPAGSMYGQPVTFTALVSATSPGTPGIPAGTVTFMDGGTPLSTKALVSGKATYKTSALAADPAHAITAVYNPTPNFATSVGAFEQKVDLADTTTKLTSSVAAWAVDQSLTFTATVTSVTGVTPEGTVDFTVEGPNGYFFSTGPLDLVAGKVTTPIYTFPPDVGDYTVTAIYDPATGPQNFAPNSAATSTQTQTVRNGVTISLNGVTVGSGVTFTSIVLPIVPGVGTPTGFVSFYKKFANGTRKLLGRVALNGNGVGSLFVNSLAAGAHTIVAEYEGDDLFSPASRTRILQGRNSGRLV